MNAPRVPLVSLLVPVFNRATLLSACLESALAQTMADFEVVVVDGGSTDGTWDTCRRLANQDPRVRAFRDPVNTGPVRGWWRCVEEARGRYATFLWSDDLLMPTFLERTVPLLADDDVAFAYTAAAIGPVPDETVVHYAQPLQRMPSDTFIQGLLLSDQFPVSPACALFRLEDIRRNFVMELPTRPVTDLTQTGAGVDALLLLLTASQRPEVAHVAEPLAFFRWHPDSITVEGREGRVALAYAITKGWFARSQGRSAIAVTILADHWINGIRRSRRITTPTQASTNFHYVVSANELMRSAGFPFFRAVVRSLSARILRSLPKLSGLGFR